MKTKRINDYRESVMNHYESGTARGKDTGFDCLNKLASFKLGYSTYLLGFGAAGKTELHSEMMFNLTERYEWKHALLSAEVGTIEDLIGELVSKHLKKPFFKSSGYGPTEKELHAALNHIDHYFFPINADETDHTIDSFYKYCSSLEKEFKIKLNTTSIDPWNDLEEDLMKYGGREDKYLQSALKKTRQTAKNENWHNFIVTHAKDMPPIALKSVTGGEVYCTAVPTLQSFAGGQVWGRRAYQVIGVWRPEEGAISPANSLPYDSNEAIVLILKTKPKGVGSKGKCSLFFDWKRNRYYEKIDGFDYYAFEHLNPNPKFHPDRFLTPINGHDF